MEEGRVESASRHCAYIPHPEAADGYNKYLLTLLGQRRELQQDDIRHKLLGEYVADNRADPSTGNAAESVPASLFLTPASAFTLEKERRELTAEVTLGLEAGLAQNLPSAAEKLREAVTHAAHPLSGLPNDAAGLAWHFRSRAAALSVERSELMRHIRALRRAHFGHVASQSLPEGVSSVRHAHCTRQLNHAGPQGPFGRCTCVRELEVADACMEAVQAAEVDAAGRAARLAAAATSTGAAARAAVEEGDWQAALLHAAAACPGGRLGQRLMDRLSLIPMSHHHRYPIYEQVAEAALARDASAAASGLRVPPKVVRYVSDAMSMVDSLLGALPISGTLIMDSNSLPGMSPSPQRSGFQAEVGESVSRTHREAYLARQLLPKMCAAHSVRWPGASISFQLNPTQDSSIRDGTSPDPSAQPPLQRDGPPPVALVQDDEHFAALLAGLVPSVEGDESAGHVAALRAAALGVDEALRADNTMLESCDARDIGDRMRALGQVHVTRWSLAEERGDGDGSSTRDESVGGSLSFSAIQEGLRPVHLDHKQMEALYTLRFLKTKRDRLRVLHYINAAVSLQCCLLRDEAREESAGPGCESRPTRANKPFTCPVALSTDESHRGAAAGLGLGGEGSGVGATKRGRSPFKATAVIPATEAKTNGGGGMGDDKTKSPQYKGSQPVPGADVVVDDEDELWEDEEAGVAVKRPDGRWVVYPQAMKVFREVEEEVLRLATHYCEQYAAQLHAGGRASEADEIDRLGVLEDVWGAEASFLAARHTLLLSYFEAYRHAADWGPAQDMFAGINAPRGPKPFHPGSGQSEPAGSAGALWGGVGANSTQPELLGARKALRREMVDICFRRPNIALHDGYFMARYINATLSLELESSLVGQLNANTHKSVRGSLAMAFATAATAASIASPAEPRADAGSDSAGTANVPLLNLAAMAVSGSPGGGGAGAVSLSNLWQPGLPAGVVYGGVMRGSAARSLMMEGALLGEVGAAVASLPLVLRSVVGKLTDLHQVKHYVEVAELKKAVLQYAAVEMGVLLREEAARAHAVPDKMPQDTKFKTNTMQKSRGEDVGVVPPVGLLASQMSWLVTSHVADNPLAFMAAAKHVGASMREAVEAVLRRESVVRSLYRSEITWCVYAAQSRALGRRLLAPEMQGIPWEDTDNEGNLLKGPETLADGGWATCEPSDTEPPGAAGPAAALSAAYAALMGVADGGGMLGAPSNGSMFGVGRAGVLGGVWRAPPLAIYEFTTHPAEGSLQIHSLEGLRAMLRPRSGGPQSLRAAAHAQALRCAALETALAHNQVLLDWVIRKLDRRRRVLTWRAAAVEGVSDDSASVDIVVGGPPGSYAPGAWVLTNHIDAEAMKNNPPPLIADPPQPKASQYEHQRRVTRSRASLVGYDSLPRPNAIMSFDGLLGSPPRSPSLPGAAGAAEDVAGSTLLDARSFTLIKANRRKLVEAVSHLWLDLSAIKLALRASARKAFVEAMKATAEQVRASVVGGGGHRRASMASSYSDYTGITAVTAAAEIDHIKLDTYDEVYSRGWMDALGAAALRADMAETARHLGVAVLGSTGGVGHDWGLKFTLNGRRLEHAPELGPMLRMGTGAGSGQVGIDPAADRVLLLLHDYAPLWQALDFSKADTAVDPDVMDWQPPSSSTGKFVGGAMALDDSGSVRLSSLWEIPTQLEIMMMGGGATQAFALRNASVAEVAAAVATIAGVDALPDLPPSPTSPSLPSSPSFPRSPAMSTGQLHLSMHARASLMGDAKQPEWMLRVPPTLSNKSFRQLEEGAALGKLLLAALQAALMQAAFMAPAHALAAGGDVSRSANSHPLTPEEQAAAQAADKEASSSGFTPLDATGQEAAQGPDGGGAFSAALGTTGATGAPFPTHMLGGGPWLQRQFPTGTALLDHMGAVSRARMAPMLPGALLAPHLTTLHTRLAHLVQPKGFIAAKANTAPVTATAVSASAALPFLAREVAVLHTTLVVAMTRARDTFAAAGPARERAWHLSGALECALAQGLANPDTAPSLIQGCALRLADADRVALHNEIERCKLLVERVEVGCGVAGGCQPKEALAVAEYTLAALWTHDRLRDAFCWRALLMEKPQAYPFPPPSDGHWLRRYHSRVLPLASPLTPRPPPLEARNVLQEMYAERVAVQAQELARAAAAWSSSAAAADASASSQGQASAMSEGKPGWLALSPVLASGEGIALEAACVVLRQGLDLQAVQVALLRLHQDCAELSGVRAAAMASATAASNARPQAWSPDPFTRSPSPYGFSSGVMPASMAQASVLSPDSVSINKGAAAALAVTAPALAALARRLVAGKTRVSEEAGGVYEVSSEDLARWLVDVAAAVGTEGKAAVATEASVAAWERAQLAGFADELEGQVRGLAADHDAFIRRHAIRVDTQVVDRAMALLQELTMVRRAALRALEDAKVAAAAAYESAQAQHAAKISELQNALATTVTNAELQRADLQKRALEAMMEVRRETLQRAFGGFGAYKKVTQSAGGALGEDTEAEGRGSGVGDIQRVLELEEQVEGLQKELIDMQRAIIKVQTWFKMRSSAFAGACMREVVAARRRVAEVEGSAWEAREAAELVVAGLDAQLRATQLDLEVAAATLARSSADLGHARAVNKRLLAWKVGAQPRMAALKIKMQDMGRHREAWLEWIGSKHGLLKRVNATLMSAHAVNMAHQRATAIGTGSDEDSGATDGSNGSRSQADGKAGASAQSSGTLVLQSKWAAERKDLKTEIESLRKQVAAERAARVEAFDRLMREAGAATGSSPAVLKSSKASPASTKPGAPQAAATVTAGNVRRSVAAGASSKSCGGAATSLQLAPPAGGPQGAAPAASDSMSASSQDLQAAYDQVCAEKQELARMLAAVRAVVPGVVASLEATGRNGVLQAALEAHASKGNAGSPQGATDDQQHGDSSREAAQGSGQGQQPDLQPGLGAEAEQGAESDAGADPSGLPALPMLTVYVPTAAAASPARAARGSVGDRLSLVSGVSTAGGDASVGSSRGGTPRSPQHPATSQLRASHSFILPAPLMGVTGHAAAGASPGLSGMHAQSPSGHVASPAHGASPSPCTMEAAGVSSPGLTPQLRPVSSGPGVRVPAGSAAMAMHLGMVAGPAPSVPSRPASARVRTSPGRGAGGIGMHAAGTGAAAVFAAKANSSNSPSEHARAQAKSLNLEFHPTVTKLSTTPISKPDNQQHLAQ